ncbi:MAG: hypothetical protein ACE5E0_06470 [Terriglobia bacterium]
MDKVADLISHGSNQGRMGVTDAYNPEAGQEIKILAAVTIQAIEKR